MSVEQIAAPKTEGTHQYDRWGGAYREPAKCDFALYPAADGGKPYVLIVTERADNVGSSVTNALELIVSGLLAKLGLALDQVTVIERYQESWEEIGGRWVRLSEETFDRVELTAVEPGMGADGSDLADPNWSRVERGTVEAWIGGAL